MAALALYGATAKPDLVGGDPGEFQLVPWLLGIAHHTGYPLYTLVGWTWTQLPLGSIAYRMNLLSAVLGAAAVGLTGTLAWRLAGRGAAGWAAGAVSGSALAVAPLHWHWSTVAGVRSGAVAEVGWMMLATAGVLATTQPGRALLGLGLAVGVALAHHRSGALALPGIALALASAPAVWRVGWRQAAAAAGLALLPLLSYLYLPVRARQGPPFHQWHPETLDGFLDLALAIEHSRVHYAFPIAAVPARAELLFVHMRGQFGQLGLALALIGCMWLLWRSPRVWLALGLFVLAQSWQVLNWDVGPDQLNVVYQLPADGTVAVWLGLGVAALVAAARRRASVVGRIAAAASVLLALAWLGQRGVGELRAQETRAIKPVNHDRAVLADGWAARRIVGGGLERVESNAVVVGDWEQATVVWYLQLVERRQPDVQNYYPVDNLRAALVDHPNRPIWLMARTAVPPDRRLSADGPFVRVNPPDRWATAGPSDATPASARFEHALELVGLAFGDRRGVRVAEPDRDGDVLPVTLYWRALGAMRPDLSISLRLIAAEGRIAAQQDNAAPALSLYPTSRWREGEVVGDYYELPYRSLTPGPYGLEVRVYLVEGGSFRDLRVGAEDRAAIGLVSR